MGAAAVFTCSTVAFLALYRGQARDRAMGWRTTATTAGGFVYPLAAGALGNLSSHAPFAVHLVALPLSVAALLALPPGRAEPGDGSAPGASNRRGALRLLRRHPKLAALCGLWVATTALMMVLAVFLPRRLDQLGIHDTLLVALYGVVIASAAASAVGLTYAKLTARLGHAVLMRIAAGAWTAALLGLRLRRPRPAPAPRAGADGARQRHCHAHPDRPGRPRRRPASPLLFGPLIDSTSITTGALTSAAGTAAILIALFRLKDPPQARPREKAEDQEAPAANSDA